MATTKANLLQGRDAKPMDLSHKSTQRGSRVTEWRSLHALDISRLQSVYKDKDASVRPMSSEIAEKVAKAIKKHDAGLPLTDKEWTLLAFTVHAAGCSSCGGR
jgi:hypothetical protein